MASPVTLGVLITRVRRRANIEGATAFITDAEITDHLNVSLANEVYDLLRADIGDNYYRKTYTLFTNQGQSVYPTPADLVAIVSVDLYLGGPVPVSGRRYYEWQRNALKAFPFGWNYTYPVYYQLQGSGIRGTISFLSAPNAGFRVDLNYVPVMPLLVNTTDIYDDINQWSEIAVLDAASKCMIKAGRFDAVQLLDARKQGMVAAIRAMGPQRHAGEPETVNMVEHRFEWGDGWAD